MTKYEAKLEEYFSFARGRNTKGLVVGVEIEAEGEDLVPSSFGQQNTWNVHEEGSLRGGHEYVLRHPLSLKDVETAVDAWGDMTKSSRFSESIRTSVHLHYNVRQFKIIEIYQVLVAYWLLENLLVGLNGPTRKGNLFCLRLTDAEFVIDKLSSEIKSENYFATWDENYRYGAVNLSALRKFGSIEFRFIRGLTKSKDIKEWIRALFSLVNNAAEEFKSPHSVVDFYYRHGYDRFIRKLLPESFVEKIYSNFKGKDIINSIEENLGLIYEIVSLLHYKAPRPFPKHILDNTDEDLRKGSESAKKPKKSSQYRIYEDTDAVIAVSPQATTWTHATLNNSPPGPITISGLAQNPIHWFQDNLDTPPSPPESEEPF